MFWNILSIENAKNLRRRLLWVEIAILAVLVIAIYLFLFISIQGTPDGVTITEEDLAKIPHLLTWPGALAFSLRMAGGSKLLLIIFVGAVTASEYTWRTYQLWLSRGVPRTTLLTAKFISFSVPILGVVLVALMCGGLISAVFSAQMDSTVNISQVNIWQLGGDILRTGYTLLPYVAITFLIAIASRSAVVAIGICTAFGLLLENTLAQFIMLLPGNFGQMAKYLPASLAESILVFNWAEASVLDEFQAGVLPPTQAAIGIAIWTLALFGLALWIFKRQDFSG